MLAINKHVAVVLAIKVIFLFWDLNRFKYFFSRQDLCFVILIKWSFILCFVI